MKLKRRLALHFSYQIIVIIVTVVLLVVWLLFLIVNTMSENDLNVNIADGVIEYIPSDAWITDGKVELNKKWHKLLQEHHMWLQIINKHGKVIYSINTPSSLQSTYSTNDLLFIEESKRLGQYSVRTFFDSWGEEPYYYLLGYKHEFQQTVKDWFVRFNDHGLVAEKDVPLLEKAVNKQHGFLQIYQDGNLVQAIGNNSEQEYSQLDVLGRIYEPGNYRTEVAVWNDKESGVSWVFHLPNTSFPKHGLILFEKETQIILYITLGSLCIALLLSIWNAHRYGRPLLLFLRWIDRLQKQEYGDLLTDKERKKVFRKSGKVRMRYRLYQEVIQAFQEMANELEIAKQERKQLEKTREEWMSGISHDLRTPLSTIQGYGHMLESDKYVFTQTELQEIGKVIREKGDYMIELVNDFTLVFQLKNSEITLQKGKVELNKFVQKTLSKFEKDLTIRNVSFSFLGTGDECYVWIDPKWFVRVLDNVIYNAVKHNPPHTDIQIQVNNSNNRAIIEVSDNGKGMTEEVANHLFERYYRGTSTNEKIDGAGLGMSIAKAIVDLHGGLIEVTSIIGEGTKIRIQLEVITDS